MKPPHRPAPSRNGLAAGEAGKGFKAGAEPIDVQNPRRFATNANKPLYEDTISLYTGMPEFGAPPAGHPLR